jgi:hypothetical protein
MDRIQCPNCKREMHINHTFNSFPNYVCQSYGQPKLNCGLVISVKEYEAKYQGELTQSERINKKLYAGMYLGESHTDMEYLLAENKRLREALERILTYRTNNEDVPLTYANQIRLVAQQALREEGK